MEKERDLYLKILCHLSKFGVNHEVDIFYLFSKSFTKPEEAYEVAWKLRGVKYINETLKGIKENGHIEYKEIKQHETINGRISWNDKFDVLAYITSKGYEFIKQQQHINNTRTIAIFAIIVSIFSASFTGYKILMPNSPQSKVQDTEPKQELLKPSKTRQIYPPPNIPKTQQQPASILKKR